MDREQLHRSRWLRERAEAERLGSFTPGADATARTAKYMAWLGATGQQDVGCYCVELMPRWRPCNVCLNGGG